MVSSFEQTFTDLVTDKMHELFSEASSLTYTPPTGAASTVDAIIGEIQTRARYDQKTGVRIKVSTVRAVVKNDALARSTVQQNGTITIASNQYGITSLSDVFAGEYTIEAQTEQPYEIAREGYRKTHGRY